MARSSPKFGSDTNTPSILVAMGTEEVRAAARIGKRLHGAKLALLRREAERLVALLGQHTQDFFFGPSRASTSGKKPRLPTMTPNVLMKASVAEKY